MLLLVAALIFVCSRDMRLYGFFIAIGLIVLAGIMIALMIGSVQPMRRAYLAGRRLMGLREKLEDTRLVGGLLEAMEVVEGETAGFVLETLTRVLKRLHAAQAGLLNARHRTILYELMTKKRAPGLGHSAYYARYPDFTVSALLALQQVGDETALPTVEYLAHSGTGERIRAAARECLPFLEKRSAEQRAHRTLLRPAEAASPSELLRPLAVTAASPEEREQLLRPGTPTVEDAADR